MNQISASSVDNAQLQGNSNHRVILHSRKLLFPIGLLNQNLNVKLIGLANQRPGNASKT